MPTKGVRFQRDPARPVAFESISVTSGAAKSPTTDLTPSTFGALAGALHENLGNGSVLYRTDGGTPTTTVGHRLAPGAGEYLNEHEARRIQWIAESTSTTIVVTFYRE